jgi:hypothetical protein
VGLCSAVAGLAGACGGLVATEEVPKRALPPPVVNAPAAAHPTPARCSTDSPTPAPPWVSGGSRRLPARLWGRVHRIAVVDLEVSEDWTVRTCVSVSAGWVGEAWRRLSNAVGHWRGGHGQGRADLFKVDCSSLFVFF